MRITLSAAITADGFLDDDTPERLVISTPGDWDAVYRLRAQHDAILVGAETLRRDNPSLLIRDQTVRARRVTEGLKPDIAKVTLTGSGNISPTLRFFTEGEAEHYVFSSTEIEDIQNITEVISTKDSITAKLIVTELEKRGVEHLVVEGGGRILRMFLDEGMADVLRLAVNPRMRLDEKGGAKFDFEIPGSVPHTQERIDGMEVTTYTFHPDTSAEDIRYLQQAVEEGRKCTPSTSSYCVGAVVITSDNQIFTGHTHETSLTHHAEQEAIAKALAAGTTLHGAAMYSSMEPCSERSSEPESCSQLLIKYGFARAVFALYEPSCFVCCRGALTLREAGIDVRVYPKLADGVWEVNAHLKPQNCRKLCP
ncbi:dihydrofolate reductase family protein [uncultured Alistipes sp.]|uniref:dihydrofolate reductase family protein n=1 Tax=uncultured Alistipes sp. TaxID=538949 RepID=UPI0025DEF9C7|nr:dihydrofolate reductase family protein [uncultured Alistipes sp.]